MTFVDSFTRARESVAGHSVVADPPTHPYLQSLAQALSEIVALGEPVVGGGSGIANRLTKWTSATVVGNANVTEDGASLSPVASGGLTLGTRALPWGEIDLINVAALVWASGGVISQYIVGDTTSLRFARGAVEQMGMTAAAFSPLTAASLTLGTAALPWGQSYVREFSTLYWVTDQTKQWNWRHFTDNLLYLSRQDVSNVVVWSTAAYFPNAAGSVTLGLSGNRWGKLWGQDADFSTTVLVTGDLTAGSRLVFTTAVSKVIPGATSLSLRNTADSADNMLITDAGAVTFRSTVGGITTLTATTLAGTLSTAAQPNVTSLGTLTSLTMGGTLTMGANTLALATSTVSGTPTWSSNQAITLSTAAQPNVTSLGTLTSLTMGGTLTMGANTLALSTSTVSGAPTWSSNQAITLSTAAQPNITSVGTLTSLTVSGAVTKTKAGGATVTNLLGGVLSAVGDSAVSTSGTGETDLKSYTVLANTLDATYRAVRFEAWGTFSGSAALQTIRVYYGGTLVSSFDNGSNASFRQWVIRGVIHYTGASAQEIWFEGTCTFLSPGAAPRSLADRALPAKSNAADQILKITGQAAAGGVTQYAFDVWYAP